MPSGTSGGLPVHICGPHLSVPGKGGECMEAMWSLGRACRKCDHPTCYRKGMTAAQAREDNAERVNPSSICKGCGNRSRPDFDESERAGAIVMTCGCRMRMAYPNHDAALQRALGD